MWSTIVDRWGCCGRGESTTNHVIRFEHGMVCGLQPPQQVQQPQQHYNNRINGKAPQFFSSFYAYLFFYLRLLLQVRPWWLPWRVSASSKVPTTTTIPQPTTTAITTMISMIDGKPLENFFFISFCFNSLFSYDYYLVHFDYNDDGYVDHTV